MLLMSHLELWGAKDRNSLIPVEVRPQLLQLWAQSVERQPASWSTTPSARAPTPPFAG